jgi:hypothetical protein
MIKRTDNITINKIKYQILYIENEINLFSYFSRIGRDFQYVIVDLNTGIVFKEHFKTRNLPYFDINNLMNIYNNQPSQIIPIENNIWFKLKNFFK